MYLLTHHDYTSRCSVCYAAQYGKQPEIKLADQRGSYPFSCSPFTIHSMTVIGPLFCPETVCLGHSPNDKCRQLAATAAIAANLELAPDRTVASRSACYAHEGIRARRRASRHGTKRHGGLYSNNLKQHWPRLGKTAIFHQGLHFLKHISN